MTVEPPFAANALSTVETPFASFNHDSKMLLTSRNKSIINAQTKTVPNTSRHSIAPMVTTLAMALKLPSSANGTDVSSLTPRPITLVAMPNAKKIEMMATTSMMTVEFTMMRACCAHVLPTTFTETCSGNVMVELVSGAEYMVTCVSVNSVSRYAYIDMADRPPDELLEL